MSKDLLAEATRALRDQEAASELEARATRTRVMAGLHQSRVNTRTRIAFLLPIAATFIAASAWGAASGRTRALFASVERWIGITSTAPSISSPRPAPARAPAAPPAPLPESAPLESPLPVPAQASVPVKSAPSSSLPVDANDPTLALYRAAHTAHFVDHDAARALTAWDAYLAAAPRGQLAPEARYNRALSLVRLGRIAEARAALAPFANGPAGGYRRAEAAALLERLSD